MEINKLPLFMEGAFWILVFTGAIGVILYIYELIWRRRHGNDPMPGSEEEIELKETPGQLPGEEPAIKEETTEDSGQCCGLHLVCEKDSLSPISSDILYYDDEELDRFKGRTPESYTPEETEEFRDVLMTLRPEDVTGWARSITQRRIELPTEVRDELLMLVNEQRRANRTDPQSLK